MGDGHQNELEVVIGTRWNGSAEGRAGLGLLSEVGERVRRNWLGDMYYTTAERDSSQT